MAKEKKFITCDGNMRQLTLATFSAVAAIYPSLRHPPWLNTPMSGLLRKKTFGETLK